jgi:hypothetical protein
LLAEKVCVVEGRFSEDFGDSGVIRGGKLW